MKKIVPLLLSGILIGQVSSMTFADTETISSNKTATESVLKTDSVNNSVSNQNSIDLHSSDENNKNIESNLAKDNAKPGFDPKTSDLSQALPINNEKSMLGNFLASNKKIKRIYGNNRSETSVEISKFTFNNSKKVIIADASDYPDALSAASITDGKYPVLLVQNTLTSNIKNEILRLGANEVVIIGGYNSIPISIEKSIRHISSDINITRINGINRYETNANTFRYSNKDSVVLASGENFPDALASSPLLKSSSLLLTRKYSLPLSTSKIFKDYKIKSIDVSGGESSISDNLVDYFSSSYRIDNIDRLSGKDRFATSTKIARMFNSKVAIVASGENFPDALAASSLSQKTNTPILLVSKNKISKDVATYIKNRGIEKLILLGGESSISEETEDNLLRLINGESVENVIKPIQASISNKKEVATENNKSGLEFNIDKNKTNESNNTDKLDISNIKKDGFYVTKKVVNLSKNESLQDNIFSIPIKKIVKLISVDGNSALIDYNGKQGWTDISNLKNYDVVKFGKVVNHVPYISQLYPVYAPNGCEPTSLLMGLKGKGYTNIGLRAYLDAIPKTKSNPRYGYVGVPYNVEEYRFQTIDPSPLAKYGQRYGNVVNIQGSSINDIIREIQNGNTVVVWVTLFWNHPYFKTLKVDGKMERRIWNNHAVLLTGYDPIKKSFFVADPYNHEKAGASRTKPFYYWKSQSIVDRAYNYDNRRFAIVVR